MCLFNFLIMSMRHYGIKISFDLTTLPAINEPFALHISVSPSGLALSLFSASRPLTMNAGHSLKPSPQS